MKKRTYQAEAEKLARAIDIAIEAYRMHPPRDLTPENVEWVVGQYAEWKHKVLNPEPQFRSLASLKYIVESVFTYFQEAAGEAVGYFWKRIEEEGLGYEREDRLKKILERGKIKGRIEYEYVTDMILVAEQTGLTTTEESRRLGQMLGEFESRKAR